MNETKGGNEMKKIKKMKGFTLIELLIVIAIVGILVAITIPMYRAEKLKSKARSALEESYRCQEVVNDLNIIKIRGKCLVWDADKDRFYRSVQNTLDDSIRAGDYDENITVLILRNRSILVGHYSISKEPVHQNYVEISAVYLPEKTAKWKYSLLTYDPPKIRATNQKTAKPNPSIIVAKFINGVLKDDIKGGISAPYPKDQLEELILVKK